MKNIFIFIFLLFSGFVFSQSPGTPDIQFQSAFRITNATVGLLDTVEISGYVDECAGRFTNSDIAIGDSIYVLEGSDLLVFGVVTTRTISLGVSTFKAIDFGGAGILPSNGQAAIFRPTTNYQFPGYICGLNPNLQQYITARFMMRLDAYLSLKADSMTVFQDSIVVLFANEVEIGRDTIRGTGGGGGAAVVVGDSLANLPAADAITATDELIWADSTIAFQKLTNQLRDSIPDTNIGNTDLAITANRILSAGAFDLTITAGVGSSITLDHNEIEMQLNTKDFHVGDTEDDNDGTGILMNTDGGSIKIGGVYNSSSTPVFTVRGLESLSNNFTFESDEIEGNKRGLYNGYNYNPTGSAIANYGFISSSTLGSGANRGVLVGGYIEAKAVVNTNTGSALTGLVIQNDHWYSNGSDNLGLSVNMLNYMSTLQNDAIGIRINNSNSGGTILGDMYALKILDGNTGTLTGNAYAISQAGTNWINNIEGNTLLGDVEVVPDAKLHVYKSGTLGLGGFSNDTELILQNSTGLGEDIHIALIAESTGTAGLTFGDEEDTNEATIRYLNESQKLEFITLSGAGEFSLLNDGQLNLAQYGTGTKTGTATYILATDASGNVIEENLSGGTILTAANNGVSLSGSTVQLGHAASGTGASDFTANRYLYTGDFDLEIGTDGNSQTFVIDGGNGNSAFKGVPLSTFPLTVYGGGNNMTLESTGSLSRIYFHNSTSGSGQFDGVSIGIDGTDAKLRVLEGGDFIVDFSGTELFKVLSTGQLQALNYGAGSITGTATSLLAVDASGNVIEESLGGGTLVTAANNGVSLSGSTVQLGHAASGSGASDFTANRYLYTGAFDFEIGSTGNANAFYLDGSTGNVGIGTTSPASRLHVYENTTSTGTSAGITIEQDSTGDAVTQYLLTGGQRYVIGIDNSDSDKFKLSYSEDVGTDNIFEASSAGFTINQHTTINGNVIVDSPDGLQFDIDGNITQMDSDETSINADSVKMSSLLPANESTEIPNSILGATVTGKIQRYPIAAIDSSLLLIKSIAFMSFTDSAYIADVSSVAPLTNLANNLYTSYTLTNAGCLTVGGDSIIVSCSGIYKGTHNNVFVSTTGGGIYESSILKNGVQIDGIAEYSTSVESVGLYATPHLSFLIELESGDVIKPGIRKASGTGDEEFISGQFMIEKL